MTEGERLLHLPNSPMDKCGSNTKGKLVKPKPATQPPNQPCPQCGSNRVWKSGRRYSKTGVDVQRWLCRDCRFRFSESLLELAKKFDVLMEPRLLQPGSKLAKVSVRNRDPSSKEPFNNSSFPFSENVEPHDVTIVGKDLNVLRSHSCKRRVCDSARSKNLDTATIQTGTVSETSTRFDPKTAKGLLLQYALHLQKEGYGVDSRYKSCIRMLINSGANLLDPENVKEVIAKKQWKDGTKMQVTYAYDAMTKMLKLTWAPPRYRQEEAFQ